MANEVRQIVKALEDQGFDVVPTKRGHLRVYKDGVLLSTLSGTPGDRRALLNGLAPLKRAGFQWPPRR
jgi:predicted RNA binding protein YcfA (HicA-like mRNA interferase family)